MPQATKPGVDRAFQLAQLEPGVIGISALFKVMRYSQVLSARDPIDIAAARVLGALAESGASRPSDIAAAIHLDLSTVSRHLGALEKQALVRKSRDPADGRASSVELTEAGYAILGQILTNRARAIAPVLDSWSVQDRDQLFCLLTRLASDLHTHVADARGAQPTQREST